MSESVRKHKGAPWNQKFNVSPKFGKKRKSWWMKYAARATS